MNRTLRTGAHLLYRSCDISSLRPVITCLLMLLMSVEQLRASSPYYWLSAWLNLSTSLNHCPASKMIPLLMSSLTTKFETSTAFPDFDVAGSRGWLRRGQFLNVWCHLLKTSPRCLVRKSCGHNPWGKDQFGHQAWQFEST